MSGFCTFLVSRHRRGAPGAQGARDTIRIQSTNQQVILMIMIGVSSNKFISQHMKKNGFCTYIRMYGLFTIKTQFVEFPCNNKIIGVNECGSQSQNVQQLLNRYALFMIQITLIDEPPIGDPGSAPAALHKASDRRSILIFNPLVT